ncbi:MAG: methionine gamma-lyase [Limisphaera sp.]|nr:MAG: methionine gamma-lyase [Limisphaera sp.]
MNDSELSHRGFSTRCVHAGTYLDPVTGGACTPIFRSTAHRFPHPTGRNIYPRYFNTPNQQVVARKVAALEGAEEGLVFASGMAAITTLLAAYLRSGDHAVFQADLYGGTWELVSQQLPRWGISFSLARTEAEIRNACRPETRLIYVESPSNPLLRCLDLAAVAAFARSRGIPTAIDNTFATPFNQNPIALGLDLVVHSATKYLNGHSDVNAGVVVGRRTAIEQLRQVATLHGGMLDAEVCARLERGLKTLALRMERHNENALRLARFLQTHPAVAQVHYPGLPEHPDHAVARRQMRGFGGMLSFELRRPEAVDRLLDRLRLILPALSLGGVESLICVPARTSHRRLSPEERHQLGITDTLVRLSVGIEDAEDLMADLDQALAPG